jgi:hypothetical protein
MILPLRPDSDHPIDAAIRAHLDAEADAVDARIVLARVKAAQTRSTPTTRYRRTWLRWITAGGGTAVAAGLLIALFLTGNTPPPEKQLSAEELLLEAKAAHETAGTDRGYDVSADWDLVPFQARFRFPPLTRKATIWTRGDQFVVLSAVDDGPQWTWGQEPSGRVWLAPNRRHAIVFEKDELNEPLARFCELMSLRMVSTLGEVLEQCDLFRKDGGAPGEPIRIEAKLRPRFLPNARFRQVELELDPQTKVVRRAVLHRFLNEESVGSLVFLFSETTTKPDDFYSVKGHTEPNAIIHDGRPLPNPRSNVVGDLMKRLQNRGK